MSEFLERGLLHQVQVIGQAGFQTINSMPKHLVSSMETTLDQVAWTSSNFLTMQELTNSTEAVTREQHEHLSTQLMTRYKDCLQHTFRWLKTALQTHYRGIRLPEPP